MRILICASLLVGACSDGGNTAGTATDTDHTPGDTVTTTDSEATEVTPETTEEVAPETTGPTGPVAKIYAVDPVVTPELTEVVLPHLTPPYGTLVGPFANVKSCTKDLDRGVHTTFGGGGGQTVEVVSCVPESKAVPGADGSYRDILPPATPAEDDGRFAELMMYYHMQVIHDFYRDFYGLTDRDESLDALTNVTTYIDRCASWAGVANAVFVPNEALGAFVTGLDVSGMHGDAIMFSGTSTKNFSLDASVIYHEYTHAMVGATRLSGVFLDDEGFNNLPGALNEAYADYFAASTTGHSQIGTYSLNDLAAEDFCGATADATATENYARDLANMRHCPDDLTAEVHADSELFSSALWAIRTELGKLNADTLILDAVTRLIETSDFKSAAENTIQSAQDFFGAEVKAKVQAIFEARNLIDCERVVPVEKVGQREIPVQIIGTRMLNPNPFPGYAPGFLQYGIDVPAGTKKVTVTLAIQSYGFGGGAATFEIEAVFKKGSAVHYDLNNMNGVTNDGDVTVALVNKNLVLQNANGSDLATGAWGFALHNKAKRSAALTGMTVRYE